MAAASKRRQGRRGIRSERLFGFHPVREALRACRRDLHELLIDPGRTGREASDVADIIAAAESRGVPVRRVGTGELQAGAPHGGTQRVALDAGPLPALELPELLRGGRGQRRILMLDGVEDPQNLGAIARVAEASGVLGLVLGRHHTAPLSPAASRASAGALEWLPVALVPNLARAIQILKDAGFWILAADHSGRSLYDMPAKLTSGDLVVVLGSEGQGLRAGIRKAADHLVGIPMRGHVDSLNVSAAGAVVLFELQRRAADAPRA